MTAGFDVALSSRISTGVDIRVLNKVIPESTLDTTVAFPGPLFGDGGSSPTIGLVRPGASTKSKDRRNKVITYLSERIVEINQGIGYLHNGSIDKRRADGKLVLVKLLKIMVENDGRLSGSPEIDKAVRSALVPHLDDLPEDANQGFIPLQRVGSLTGLPAMDNSDVIATTTLHASALDKIQNFLLRGQRKQAYHYALDQHLWAHAMVIASGIDKDSWQEVVREFIKTELGIKTDPARLSLQLPGEQLPPSVNGREGLRAAYGLFTGQGATSVQELVPQNLLAKATSSLVPPLPQVTPMTPNFPGAAAAGNIPPEALSNWAETVCMMLSTTITNEVSATLLCLGDQLYANHWVEAAHVCYLLSSQTQPNGNLPHPPIGGIGHPSARIVLAGSRNPQSFPIFYKDPDALILTEVIEFALSLATLPKGQEPFAGLPHLQAYRFIRAVTLIELGYISETSRYCEAITTALARPSPYFNDTLLEQLKGLSDRLQGVAHSDKNSWIGGKLGKPSLDSIGGWLEGRFTKLVTGDVDSPGLPSEETAKPDGPGFSNTFSQYSTISSAAPSTSPSPQSSVVNLSLTAGGATLGSYRPPDRSSSAMDQRRKQTAPPPRIASASAATTTFSQAYSLGHALNNYHPMSTTSEANAPRMTVDEAEDDDPDAQVVTWWGDIDSHRTPTAANFMRANNVSLVPTGDGFMSPMGNIPFSPHPNAQRSFQSSNRVQEEDEEEDLGFGNSKSKDKEVPYDPGNLQEDAAPEKKVDKKTERPDAKPTGNASSESSGSWFGRWFKKSDTPAPVKASLGEETSFYYDKELKKWVNKKAGGAEAATPLPPPPPPSRPQTASPGMTGPRQTSSNAGPARSASAMDLTSPPKRSVPRVRSNLAPTPESESTSTPVTPPPPSTTPGLVPPPSPMPGRPKSSTSKRPIRNRYVDVFAQEGGGAA
ncbi:hypothetical protein BDZ89DRAFT_1205142 [Hymenopellis radicata]|nr:hypothetical protein BDZ89DRAFT_1205142 [Hymenopellis radicata]